MPKKKALSANMEDYLEAIFHISAKKQAARAKDIAERLKVNNASVTGALRVLSEKGFINYAPYDIITLTGEGKKLAEDIVRRHEILKDFFTKVLYVDEAEAEDTACKMEHAMSPLILERLIRFVEFIEICPRGGEEWIQGFRRYCEKDGTLSSCAASITACLDELEQKREEFASQTVTVVSLAELEPDQRGRLLKIKGKGTISKRLTAMDITPGSLIEVENIADDGSEVDIKVRGYHLTIGEDDAARIMVEVYH